MKLTQAEIIKPNDEEIINREEKGLFLIIPLKENNDIKSGIRINKKLKLWSKTRSTISLIY